MRHFLNHRNGREFANQGLSRRNFGRISAVLAASALPFYNESALAQLSATKSRLPPGAVKIDANENPLGPCPEALDAVHKIVSQGGRLLYWETFRLQELLAEHEGLKPDYVQPYAGSAAPLHQSVLAFCSSARSFVVADPGYEAGELAAEFIGAKVFRVPLTANYGHDVKKMAGVSPDAGLIYVCNPNNPSGTLTPRGDIEWLLENKPKGSVVLLDEAYIHFSGAPVCTDLVAKDKDLVVLRTFSKIYGMAGLRAGAAFGRPDLLKRLGGFGFGALPITGVAAAIASLRSKSVVPERRKIVADVREDVLEFLYKHNFQYVPSVSNKFMLDVKRPGQQVIDALRKEQVYVGRIWPTWPTHVRVSIGTHEEMNKFKAALLKAAA